MTMLFDRASLAAYPKRPGVYLMKDSAGVVIYIGKAKNLQARLRQYLISGGDDRPQVPQLLEALSDIEVIIVGDENAALLLEAKLIRRFRPKYNVLLKDDRSDLLLRLTLDHAFPRIEYVRSKNVRKGEPGLFGPFSSTRDLFDLAVRLFQLRQCSDDEFKRRTSPCILHQMKRCSAPCVGAISQKEYSMWVDCAKEFLSGKADFAEKLLKEEMQKASDNLNFELAGLMHRRLLLLDGLAADAKGARIRGIHDLDVIAVAHDEGLKHLSLTRARYREAVLLDSRSWFCRREAVFGTIEEAILSLVLQMYCAEPEALPSEVAVPHICGQTGEAFPSGLLQSALSQIAGKKVKVAAPSGGAKAKLLSLAQENAAAHLAHQSGRYGALQDLLLELQKRLLLRNFPGTIDCFDASHFGGTEMVAAVVSFEDGVPNKKLYRTYKSDFEGDDCAALQQAVIRRYADGQHIPNLILVDGGLLQLRAVHESLSALDIAVDLASISKEEGRHDRGLSRERIWILGQSDAILFPENSPELHFLQKIRDEAHRFVLSFQKKQRSAAIRKSIVDEIPGIGPEKKKRLLTAFSGVDALRAASEAELVERARVSRADAKRIAAFFASKNDLG